MKNRGATKWRGCRKSVCASSSAVMTCVAKKCAHRAYPQADLRIFWTSNMETTLFHFGLRFRQRTPILLHGYVAPSGLETIPNTNGWPLEDPHQPGTLESPSECVCLPALDQPLLLLHAHRTMPMGSVVHSIVCLCHLPKSYTPSPS